MEWNQFHSVIPLANTSLKTRIYKSKTKTSTLPHVSIKLKTYTHTTNFLALKQLNLKIVNNTLAHYICIINSRTDAHSFSEPPVGTEVYGYEVKFI